MKNTICSNVQSLIGSGSYSKNQLVDEFVRINVIVWGETAPSQYIWTLDKVSQQFTLCPDLQYCAIVNSTIVATLTMMFADRQDIEQCTSWLQISAGGTLANHNPNGDCVFGVDLSALPGYSVTSELMDTAFKQSVVGANKRGAFLGSRVPSLFKKSTDIDVDAYVRGNKTRSNDPEVRLYQKQGFRIVRIIPHYMHDPESRGYGVLMFWENPYYQV